MALNEKVVIAQIDDVLKRNSQVTSKSKYDDLSDLDGNAEMAEVNTAMSAALSRLAPRNSDYVTKCQPEIENHGIGNFVTVPQSPPA